MNRGDILDRACELYLQGGLDAVSMRRLARDLGVTAPALYRYCTSREEILLDVVGEAYRMLAERLSGALSGRTPAERFLLAGRGYLDFALEHPRYYEMLYTPAHTLGIDAFPEDLTARITSLGQFFHDRVRECVDTGLLEPGDPQDVSTTLWAHAHGLISIYLRGCLDVGEDEFRALYDQSCCRVLDGMGTRLCAAEMDQVAGGGAGQAETV